ncbi:MAG TPA: hypothetical protein VM290_11530 [Gaiellaceae bacterium]|nr:hypothetical protein [Gaiellaceae bacterium]
MRALRAPAALALAAAALHLAEAAGLPSPWLLPDERAFADGARSLVVEARDGPRTLWSLLVAPLWLADTGTAALLVRVVGAAALALALVPTYLLARLLGGQRAAAAGAALVAVAAPALYATALLPVGPAVLAAATGWYALATARPLAGGALLVLAAALWPALLPLALVGLAAAAVARFGAAPFLRWPGASVFVVAAAAAYPAYRLGRRSAVFAAAADDPAAALAAAAASLGSFAAGLGVVPLVLALAAAVVGPARRLALLLALALAGLALSGGVTAAGSGRSVDDAPLLAAAPLVGAWLAAAVAPGRLRPAAVAAAAALVVAFAAVAGRGDRGPRGAGLALAEALAVSPAVFALLALAVAGAAVAGAAIVRGSRAAARALAAPVAAAAALPLALAAQLVAWGDAAERARELRAAVGSPPDATAAAADGADVVLAGAGAVAPAELETLLFWTPTARVADPPLARRAVAPETGAFDPPLRTDGLVLEVGTEVVGEPVALLPAGRLVRPGGAVRAAQTVEGLMPDGWSGARVVLRRFAAPPSQRLVVRVSREAWGGPHVGGTVRVHLEPAGAEPRLVAEFEVPERAAHEVEVEVPPAPFALVLELPTFSPAQFGEADQRELGAQVSFAYA